MPSGVVTCPTCRRDLRAGLLVCPNDGTRLGPAPARKDKQALLEGRDQQAKTVEEDDPAVVDTAPRVAPLTGRRLGDYVVGDLLGSGGMGEVYEGEQPLIGKKVAIKVLKKKIASDALNVARMLSEARAVNAIRHRGIVDVFNFGTLDDGRPYLVMEYLEGESLDQLLRKRISLGPLEAVELLEEICSALAAAHARGIVHRDLKPANVFVITEKATRVRYTKLLDFGLAKDREARPGSGPRTAEGFVVGTPDYIAPEQARGLAIGPHADLYSLGVMAFELVTGRLPFTGASAMDLMNHHVSTPAPAVASVQSGVPPALEKLISQLLEKEPAARPESADAVRRRLATMKHALREGETLVGDAPLDPMSRATEPFAPVEEPPAPRGSTVTTRASRRSGWWVAAAIAAALALAGGAAVLLRPAPPPQTVPLNPVLLDPDKFPLPGASLEQRQKSPPAPPQLEALPEGPAGPVAAPEEKKPAAEPPTRAAPERPAARDPLAALRKAAHKDYEAAKAALARDEKGSLPLAPLLEKLREDLEAAQTEAELEAVRAALRDLTRRVSSSPAAPPR